MAAACCPAHCLEQTLKPLTNINVASCSTAAGPVWLLQGMPACGATYTVFV